MKASRVLERYAAGERNFQRLNLRGQSFKGKNLSGSDFSEAHIRSANFTGANLIGANFAGAKCGLQKRWATILTILSSLLASISGFFLTFFGYFITMIFDFSSLNNQITGWVSLIVLLVFLIVAICRGVSAVTGVGVLGVPVALSVTIGTTFTGVTLEGAKISGLGAMGFAVAMTFAIVVAGAITFAVAIAVSRALTFAGAVAGAVAGTVAGTVAGVGGIGVLEVEAGEALKLLFVVLITIVVAVAAGYIGWRAMRGDARDAWLRSFAIAFAAIGGTSFKNAQLIDADFSRASLKSTDFRGANLTRTYWRDAQKLDLVRPGQTYLKNEPLRQLLTTGTGQNKNFDYQDFRGINLSGANLENASLIDTDFYQANLQGSNLFGAILVRSNFERADWRNANLTGSCIQYWIITESTKLNEIICDYVYLKEGKQERRPHDPKKKFAPGEFTKLFQKALETVDLIFSDGIDWQAFLASFEKLQVECGGYELAIQAIEKKSGGAFVIRVEVPPDADKAEVEKYLKREYEIQLKAIEDRYRSELNAKDKEIEIYKQKSADILELAKLAANRPINLSQTQGNNMAGDRNIHMGSGNYNERINGNYVQGDYYAPEQKQTLAEAAVDIQQLLTQLQSQGFSSEDAQQQAANDLATKAKDDPTTLGKLVKWGQSLGDTAAKTTVSEAAKEVLKIALKLSGVPIP